MIGFWIFFWRTHQRPVWRREEHVRLAIKWRVRNQRPFFSTQTFFLPPFYAYKVNPKFGEGNLKFFYNRVERRATGEVVWEERYVRFGKCRGREQQRWGHLIQVEELQESKMESRVWWSASMSFLSSTRYVDDLPTREGNFLAVLYGEYVWTLEIRVCIYPWLESEIDFWNLIIWFLKFARLVMTVATSDGMKRWRFQLGRETKF